MSSKQITENRIGKELCILFEKVDIDSYLESRVARGIY